MWGRLLLQCLGRTFRSLLFSQHDKLLKGKFDKKPASCKTLDLLERSNCVTQHFCVGVLIEELRWVARSDIFDFLPKYLARDFLDWYIVSAPGDQ